ncbi:MAG TPA: hypothetical protein VFE22_03625 [Edaphobacter sp.]|jgi:hypothetical protein|nr:hypothetical protein [Edaphobacter sp.]
MAFDWYSYLALAKTLAAATTDEASLRSAVSRSYYSAFNLAMLRAEANGYRNRFDATGSSHDLLWQLYSRNAAHDGCVRLSLLGPRMKRRRVKADYRHVFPKLSEELSGAIEDADECVAILSSLPGEFPINQPRSWSF